MARTGARPGRDDRGGTGLERSGLEVEAVDVDGVGAEIVDQHPPPGRVEPSLVRVCVILASGVRPGRFAVDDEVGLLSDAAVVAQPVDDDGAVAVVGRDEERPGRVDAEVTRPFTAVRHRPEVGERTVGLDMEGLQRRDRLVDRVQHVAAGVPGEERRRRRGRDQPRVGQFAGVGVLVDEGDAGPFTAGRSERADVHAAGRARHAGVPPDRGGQCRASLATRAGSNVSRGPRSRRRP